MSKFSQYHTPVERESERTGNRPGSTPRDAARSDGCLSLSAVQLRSRGTNIHPHLLLLLSAGDQRRRELARNGDARVASPAAGLWAGAAGAARAARTAARDVRFSRTDASRPTGAVLATRRLNIGRTAH